MRRIFVFSCLIVASALACGAVFAAEQIKATPCVASAPSDLAHLKGLAPTSEYPLAAGRVIAVDAKTGRITVSHAPIARFLLQAETRIFRVEDPTLLTGLTAGDKIRFDLARDGKSYVITRIQNSL